MNYLLSLLRLKCPQCRSGKMFPNAPYALIGFPKVLERCPNCKVKFSQEPSFFYGSMYVSYALGVGLAIVVFFLLYFLGWVQSPTPIFIAIVVVISILSPYLSTVKSDVGFIFHSIQMDPKRKSQKIKLSIMV